jgi:hypothetical protein
MLLVILIPLSVLVLAQLGLHWTEQQLLGPAASPKPPPQIQTDEG